MSHTHDSFEHINEKINDLYHSLESVNNTICNLSEKITTHMDNLPLDNKPNNKNDDYHIFEKQYQDLQLKRLNIHKELIKYNNQKEKAYNTLKTNMAVSTDDIYLCNSSPIKQNF